VDAGPERTYKAGVIELGRRRPVRSDWLAATAQDCRQVGGELIGDGVEEVGAEEAQRVFLRVAEAAVSEVLGDRYGVVAVRVGALRPSSRQVSGERLGQEHVCGR
jgi:hypothetical protein